MTLFTALEIFDLLPHIHGDADKCEAFRMQMDKFRHLSTGVRFHDNALLWGEEMVCAMKVAFPAPISPKVVTNN